MTSLQALKFCKGRPVPGSRCAAGAAGRRAQQHRAHLQPAWLRCAWPAAPCPPAAPRPSQPHLALRAERVRLIGCQCRLCLGLLACAALNRAMGPRPSWFDLAFLLCADARLLFSVLVARMWRSSRQPSRPMASRPLPDLVALARSRDRPSAGPHAAQKGAPAGDAQRHVRSFRARACMLALLEAPAAPPKSPEVHPRGRGRTPLAAGTRRSRTPEPHAVPAPPIEGPAPT